MIFDIFFDRCACRTRQPGRKQVSEPGPALGIVAAGGVIEAAVLLAQRELFPVVAAEVAAGAEYLGAPQYLLLAMLGTTFLVLLLRVVRIAPRHS